MDSSVLFICTGNYYRSRFAEALFNHYAELSGLRWCAISRGLAIDRVIERNDLSSFTLAGLVERGVERRHISPEKTALTAQDLANANLIIGLCEAEHRPLIEKTHPLWADQVIYWKVPDLPHCSPNQALSEIECEILLLLNLLAGRNVNTALRRPLTCQIPCVRKFPQRRVRRNHYMKICPADYRRTARIASTLLASLFGKQF